MRSRFSKTTLDNKQQEREREGEKKNSLQIIKKPISYDSNERNQLIYKRKFNFNKFLPLEIKKKQILVQYHIIIY